MRYLNFLRMSADEDEAPVKLTPGVHPSIDVPDSQHAPAPAKNNLPIHSEPSAEANKENASSKENDITVCLTLPGAASYKLLRSASVCSRKAATAHMRLVGAQEWRGSATDAAAAKSGSCDGSALHEECCRR